MAHTELEPTVLKVHESESGQEGEQQSYRIRPINLNNSREIGVVLKMFLDPANKDHISNIRTNMEVSDLVLHYKTPDRHGFVAIDRKGQVVGVFDLTPQGQSAETTAPVVLAGGMLNKLCVDSKNQRQKTGPKLRAEAERIAFEEYKWPNLMAGIVLDENQTEESRTALEVLGGWGKFIDKYTKTDARGKLFLRDGKWEARGTIPDNVFVESTNKFHDVLLIVKTRASWLAEQGIPLEGK